MVDLNFNIANQKLQINLATLPEGCHMVALNLPDGNCLAHHFNVPGVDTPTITIETLPGLVNEFVEYLEVYEGRKETTLKGYRTRLTQFTKWLRQNSKREPSESSTWVVYFASLKRRKLSVYTRKGHYHILKRFGDWLIKKGYLFVNPLVDVNAPDLPKKRKPKAIFRENIRLMLTAVDNVRDRAVLLFFRDTGCRATEALSLTWGDVQLNKGKANVMGKGTKERSLYFKPVTRQALKIYRETVSHKKTDPVWWSRKGSMTYDGLYKIFKRLAEKVDIGDEHFNPHAWRHAFGRDTTKAGIPTVQLQDLLGHSSTEVTKIYTQFDSSELQEAHNRYSPIDEDVTFTTFSPSTTNPTDGLDNQKS